MIFYVVEISGKKYIEAKGVIDETNYANAVNQLEEVMRAVYPEVFFRTSEFVNVERSDGETDTLTYEEARRLDLRFRERQIPQNSKLNG